MKLKNSELLGGLQTLRNFCKYVGVLSSRYSGGCFPELKKIVRTVMYVILEKNNCFVFVFTRLLWSRNLLVALKLHVLF